MPMFCRRKTEKDIAAAMGKFLPMAAVSLPKTVAPPENSRYNETIEKE